MIKDIIRKGIVMSQIHSLSRIRGVNLGNWLVLEKWMYPGLFDGTDAEDETWLARTLDREELKKRMKHHRNTYITERDFRWIAAQGLNTVRIPVPYFIFGDRQPFIGCIEYLDKAFDWAEKYDLKIIVDLHTAPGGQNGYDNGGIMGVCKWHKNPDDVVFVLHVLTRLAKRYGKRQGLLGIEVLNEPISRLVYMTAPSTGKAADPKEAEGSGHIPMRFLRKFYKTAYAQLRKYLPEEKAIIFHDGFRMDRWGDFFNHNGMKNVYMDIHVYISAMEGFVKIHNMFSYKAYIGFIKRRIRAVQKNVNVLVGEWCISNEYANNYSPRPGSHQERIAVERMRRYREVADLQLEAWEEASGWIYWSYKLYPDAETPMDASWKDSWDFRRCRMNKWFPGAGRFKTEQEN